MRQDLKSRDETKQVSGVAKKVRKRKEALDRIAQEKKENRLAMLASISELVCISDTSPLLFL